MYCRQPFPYADYGRIARNSLVIRRKTCPSFAESAQAASGRHREPTRNVRDRLVTLLSVSSPLARQRGCLVHTLGS